MGFYGLLVCAAAIMSISMVAWLATGVQAASASGSQEALYTAISELGLFQHAASIGLNSYNNTECGNLLTALEASASADGVSMIYINDSYVAGIGTSVNAYAVLMPNCTG